MRGLLLGMLLVGLRVHPGDGACHRQAPSATMTADMQRFYGFWFFYGGSGPA